MPLGQLVVSASTDGCIKMWDPVARAHSLTHKDSRVAVKPGHYTKSKEEGTITNESFSEVRRIYTGELTCYSLIAISHRIPLLDANDAIPKFQNIEFLASLELGKAQKSAGRLRTEGQIKVYGVERIGIEIPVSRFEEPIPKQLWAELNDLAIQTRQSSKLLFKRTLSTSLDKLMSKLVIQKAEISKVSGLLKSVTLQRYTNKDDERYSSRLFELLINLPIRNNTENERVLTIDELHMHLKRNNYLYPSSIGKDAFVMLVRDLIHKNKRYLVDHRTKNQNKVLNAISQKIISNELDIDLFFAKEVYSWNEMKKVLEPIAADDDQMEEFLTNLDPFYSNSIKLDAIKNFFSTEIIEAKIKDFARPSLIISQINAKLNKANKVELLRNLFMADSQGVGRINIVSFLSAFSSLSRQIDENLLKELYQLLAEKHENELLLDLSYFCKKLLSHTEQFELARVYNALSKIKNSLRFRLMTLEDIFIDGETEFKGRSVQNLVITVSQFKAKVKELDITGLTEKDMSLIGNFLCTLDNEGVSSISYLNLNSYFKKIDLKYQFINLADYKQLVKEIKKIIKNKEDFLRKWKAVCNRELVGYAEIRILLNYFAINEDTIDMILLKFVDTETSSVLFFNKISSFLEMNAFLDDTKNLKEENAKSLALKLLASQKDQGKEQEIETLPENNEKPRDSFDDLVDVIFKYDNRKTCSSALNVCKKFDKENTGRVNIADFINILLYNMDFGKHPETETVLFKFQNEMGMQNQMKTIEYTELFDRVEAKRGTSIQKAQSMIMDKLSGEEETNLTLVIGKISDAIRGSNFNLEKALAFFDRDNMGLVMPNNFRKILHWSKANLNEPEIAILEENLLLDNAINYKKFLDLLEINDKHINVQFNGDFWFAASKMVPFGLFGKLNQNLEFLRYTLSIYKKKERSDNPLITASILETILNDVKEFSNEEVQAILKYGVVGSINKIQQSIHKMESNELNWSFEYIHILHFLASIPVVFNRKKDLPENKDLGRKVNEQDKEETERNHIVAKVKSMLQERGVTMWESLLTCSISVIEGSKIIKSDFLRMLRIMDLDLTMKEKVLILKSLDPRETGKIDLNNLLKTFESSDLGNMKTVQQSLLLEKMIYTLYYGGYSLGRAFDFIDEEKTGQISQKEFRHGIAKLSVNFSLFEINKIMEILGLVDPFTRITKSEFKKILKKLSKKYGIDPMQNFSISLLAKIKSIITTKNKNMLENFIEEDLHKSGYADLEMMKKALQKFGLNNIEMHEINTLVKMFKTDVNVNPADEELSEPEVEENKTLSLDLSAPQAKKEEEKEEEKLNINNPNFRIDYKEFVARIYEEVENNSRLMIQGAFQVIRKVYNMTRIREFTIFEVFVYFDVNNLNMVSNMELRVGLQNLEIRLEKFEMTALWNVLEKNKENKVTYTSFFNAFLNAGCIDVIQFDDKILKMLKKFNFLLSKHGNMDELFRKFDLQQIGYVCLAEFKTASEKMRLEFNGDELETMFKAFCTPEMLNPKLKKKKDGEDSDRGQQSHRSFNFKNFVTVMSFFRNRTNGLKLLHRLDVQVRDKGMTYKKMFEDYLQGPGGKKKGTRNNTSRGDSKDVLSLTMADIKAMLQTFKFNFTLDEINQICDTFETEVISPKVMISVIESAVHKIENEANDRKNLYSKFVKEIDEAIQSRNTNVQKVFFEFDGRKDGTLRLGEFGDMIAFLQIRANKTEVKSIFEEIDFDKNGHITMKEFQSFFDQTTFRDQNQELKDVQAKPTANHLLLDPVLKKLQECAMKKQTSLERVIQGQQSDLNQIISLKLFEKALLKMDCVLKREELKLVVESASKDQSCSWGDLIDWGIKNNVDSRTKEKIYAQFPPSVQVLLSKLMQIYKKVNISVDTGYKYFLKTTRRSLSARTS
jgi:Ca2+-binding EF-hand superfamily protein